MVSSSLAVILLSSEIKVQSTWQVGNIPWHIAPFSGYNCECQVPPVFIVNTFVYSQTVESPRWSDERDVTTHVLYHLTELLKLITNCSYVIFYWPLTNVLLLESPIIDTIYLVKLLLIGTMFYICQLGVECWVTPPTWQISDRRRAVLRCLCDQSGSLEVGPSRILWDS